MLSSKEVNYILSQLFGEDAEIKQVVQNTDSIYVDVLDSSVRKPGEYFINKVASDNGYMGLMIQSLTFATIKEM